MLDFYYFYIGDGTINYCCGGDVDEQNEVIEYMKKFDNAISYEFDDPSDPWHIFFTFSDESKLQMATMEIICNTGYKDISF
jgi:hypothetical protein